MRRWNWRLSASLIIFSATLMPSWLLKTMVLPKQLRDRVRQRAQYRCEYCHYPEILNTAPLSIDHIFPCSLGGTDDSENLALACRRCNERLYNFTESLDPETGRMSPLFNPRRQSWGEHFSWSADGLRIVGTTPTGRATCDRLDLNDEKRPDRFIQMSRRQWIRGGFHPPSDDPKQE
ncbi:MAG: HNH endonuclease signature motif containing protein [Cyanobacteria bacterium J06606_4]